MKLYQNSIYMIILIESINADNAHNLVSLNNSLHNFYYF